MEVTDSRIEAIVDRVVEQLTTGPIERPRQEEQNRQKETISWPQFEGNRGCFPI